MNGLRVDDLVFEVRLSARRKTMQITVDRDGTLLLTAPPSCSERSCCLRGRSTTWSCTNSCICSSPITRRSSGAGSSGLAEQGESATLV